MIIDSHSHLFWSSYDDDREEVLARAREAGVERMIVVGTDAATSRAAHGLCREYEGCHPTAGIHPHEAQPAASDDLDAVAELCALEEVVGVGETGLDFFKEYSPRARQEELFHWHLDLARRLDKPVIVHSRDAHERTAAILAEHRGVRGVMHCYTMGPAELEPYLDLGLAISFSGVVTFPRNEANREAARSVPSGNLLVETDCPFLAPQSRRGRRNEPAYVALVLEVLARARGERLEALAAITSANAVRLFGLDGVGD